jgi:hypothetical protein
MPHKLKWINPLKEEAEFNLSSSKPELMQPAKDCIKLREKGSTELLFFLPE